MHAVVYARYSSEKQDSTSIDDQLSVCRARANRDGFEIIAMHHDGAVSGSTQVGSREGGKALLADAMAGRFEVLLLEGLDRLSRDQVEQESIVRRLEHRNIRIIGVCDGYDSEAPGRKVMRGVRGLINEIYLDDLRAKTHRGMAGQFDRGFIAGGKLYGYDIEKTEQGSRYVINEEEAAIVRWIFRSVAEGKGYRAIALKLNDDGVISPRGNKWTTSGVYGSPLKGTGMINNSLYAGIYIWNRSQWVKDPDTGKRKRIERPQSEWKKIDVPELRIIDKVTWAKVRHRIDDGRDEYGRKSAHRPLKSLLGGILRCPHCQGPMAGRDRYYYGCSVHHNTGPLACSGYRIRRQHVDNRMLSIVRQDLLSPAAARLYEKEFRQHLKDNSNAGKVKAAKKRLGEVEQEISRMIDAIVSVGASPALSARLKAAERERDSLNEIVGQGDQETEVPDIRGIFKRQLLNLGEALKREPEIARTAMGQIFGRVGLELRGNEVWGQIKTSPALLMVAGDASRNGSGDRI
ncbi:recombinase family protein [Vreelandella populi]|uniref:recombinase family protein n=1 Tax=Vreelandella populi TaxID=2498858 RepID=UPI000F8DAF6C|nr:recombinase family protein [Halomonas populi]RUR52749.1 recombinase family protein [Halomonas populi]